MALPKCGSAYFESVLIDTVALKLKTLLDAKPYDACDGCTRMAGGQRSMVFLELGVCVAKTQKAISRPRLSYGPSFQ
jgi:hypothetical protein